MAVAPAVQRAGNSPPRATYFWLDPKVGKRSSPHCARPLAAPRGSLRCSKTGPGQNSLRSPSAHSAQTGWPSLMGGVPAARGPLFCAARRRRGAIPNTELSARCLQTASRGSAVGCWELPLCAAEQRKNPGARAAGATRDLARAACLSRANAVSAASSARPLGSEQHREPRAAGRAQCGLDLLVPFGSSRKELGRRAEIPARCTAGAQPKQYQETFQNPCLKGKKE
jgi:hypothetical protein